MLARIEPFWTWHTPIAWTAYILLLDGIIYRSRGSSWLMSNRREFFFLGAVSIPLWLVFEAYNLLIRNWHYINLPQNPIVRYLSYAWAFATISPGIFQTAELVAVLQGRVAERAASSATRERRDDWPTICLSRSARAMLVVPRSGRLLTSRHRCFSVLSFCWIRSTHAPATSLCCATFAPAATTRLINLLAGGFVCGGLWEFWNYWARAKWVYTVPILGDVKIFEMPVLGYFGFPPFALECFTMYVFVRRLLWRGTRRALAV